MRIRWIPAWPSVALVVVAVASAANVIHVARRTPPAPRDVPRATFDPLSWHEQRFQRLRAVAKARGVRGTIGYIGDQPSADDDFYYAQFALVPLLLDFDPAAHEWAVANLRASPPRARVPAGWKVSDDLGDGVLLLRQSAP